MLTIRGARVVTPGKDLGVTTFSVDGGRIAAVGGVCSSRNCTHEEVGAIRGTAQDPSVNCADGCRTPFVGATCLGVHLEGSFFNPDALGTIVFE